MGWSAAAERASLPPNCGVAARPPRGAWRACTGDLGKNASAPRGERLPLPDGATTGPASGGASAAEGGSSGAIVLGRVERSMGIVGYMCGSARVKRVDRRGPTARAKVQAEIVSIAERSGGGEPENTPSRRGVAHSEHRSDPYQPDGMRARSFIASLSASVGQGNIGESMFATAQREN